MLTNYPNKHNAHPILTSAAYVVERSSHVFINQNNLENLAEHLLQDVSHEHWLEQAPTLVKNYFASLSLPNRILFLTIFHTIGFCYWGVGNKRWTVTMPSESEIVEYSTIVKIGDQPSGKLQKQKYLSTQVFCDNEGKEGKEENKGACKYNGTNALLVNMANNANFLDLEYLAKVNFEQFKKLLAGHSSQNIDSLLLLEERHQLLISLAKKLLSNTNLLAALETTALELTLKFANDLPGFLDMATYKGEQVLFLKRAQLLVFDINHILLAAGQTGISKIEELTAFADYKLPQILHHYKVINYTEALAKRIYEQTELTSGSEEEVEIRAATITAVEFIKQLLLKNNQPATSATIDNALWLHAQKLDKTIVEPYHRCKTVFY